jgi:alanyl-tRNA synthetase
MFQPGRVEASDGWVEIWNLVFMQFVRETVTGPLEKLPKPSVDTGAGLERMTAVLQGKKSNYETDLFRPLLESIAADIKKPYTASESPDDVSMRVIADHSRATAFLIADGVLPSNEGRGYVLRRIMRRAIRHGKRLGFEELFFHRACMRVIDRMEAQYPELRRAASSIQMFAEKEEASFRNTLDRGLKLLRDAIDRAKQAGANALNPDTVADLYDTYGFPMDLTRVIAGEHMLDVSEEMAELALKKRQETSGKTELMKDTAEIDKLWFMLRAELGPTQFVGYAHDEVDGKVRALLKNRQRITEARAGDEISLLLDCTAFYAESGGQVGDSGVITWPGGKMIVKDTQKPLPEVHVHVGRIEVGSLAVGASVHGRVNAELRDRTRQNHSATHLLHLALKEVLGAHVQQKGSLVAPDRLRFDYAHFEPLTVEQTERIETRVNQMIQANAPTETVEGSMEDARSAGAVMLFGEKYGDSVRMVRIGRDSLELCGGTHVRRAGDIGLFKIVSDAALASGVRRLEAISGLAGLDWVQKQERLVKRTSGILRTSVEELPDRVEKLLQKSKQLEKELEQARAAAAMGASGGVDPTSKVEEIGGIRVLVHRADGTPKSALRELADRLRDKIQSGVVILGAADDDRASLLVAVTKDLAGKVHAGAVVKAGAEAMGGKGGGRPDLAEGGGVASRLQDGLEGAKAAIKT